MNEALQKTEVQIFLVTAISYLMGFLIYGGYLSAFAGSTGNTPFALTDISLIDLIAILPMAIITVLTKAFQAIPRLLLYLLVYGLIPALVSVVVYLFVPLKIYPPWAVSIRLAAIALWIGVEFFLTWNKVCYRSRRFLLYFILLMVAAFFYGISAPTTAELQATSTGVGPQPINYVLTGIIIVFSLLTMYAVGILTAEATVEMKALSRVSRLVLQQPIPTLETANSVGGTPTQEVSHRQFWPFQPPAPIKSNSEVFVCEPPEDRPIYLVSSFRNFTLFYIPKNPLAKALDGRIITVSNQLIFSMELHVNRGNSQ